MEGNNKFGQTEVLYCSFELCAHIYRPQRSCGKVMFSQASVILFTGRVYSIMHWGRHPPRANTPRATTPPADTSPTAEDGKHPTGMHSCLLLVTEFYDAYIVA